MTLSDPAGMGLEILSWALATIFVFARGYAQVVLQRIFTPTDSFILLAYLILTTIMCGDVYCYKAGQWEINLSDGDAIREAFKLIPSHRKLQSILALEYAEGGLYFCCIWSIKAAFLLLYFSLIPKGFTAMRRCLWALTALTFVTFVITFCLIMFSCLPMPRNWALDDTYCSSFSFPFPYWFSVAAHTLTDICIYALPFFLLNHLNLNHRRKIGVAAMFALGFISIAVGVIRTVLVGTEFRQSYVDALSAIEMGTAIMVICCPSLIKIFKRSHVVNEAVEWGTMKLGFSKRARRVRPKGPLDIESSLATGSTGTYLEKKVTKSSTGTLRKDGSMVESKDHDHEDYEGEALGHPLEPVVESNRA